MNSVLLDVHALSKSYLGKSVLQNLELQLQAGQRLSIQGPSGCGKSTFLRILAGLEGADSGQITLCNHKATDGARVCLPPWRRGIQMVFQDLGLWPTRNVLQHVVDVRKAAGLAKPQQVGKNILQQLGLQDLLHRKPGKLSGGEARRLALARVMALEPQLILLDEAFSSLDSANREQAFGLLEQVLTDTHAAVILVTHDSTEAVRLGGIRMRFHEGGLVCV